MKLPELIYGNNKTRRQTVAFGGVNYSENHAEGEWEETENLGSGRWPALAPRLGRAVARECEAAPTALYAWEELASVEGTGFYYGGQYIGEVSAGPKQMVRVGDQIVIWPDRKYYDWKTGTFLALEAGFSLPAGPSTIFGTANDLAIPEVNYAWVAADEAAVRHEGAWLGVAPGSRAGVRYTVGRLAKDSIHDETGIHSIRYYVTGTSNRYLNQCRVGEMIKLSGESRWGEITAVSTENQEYMPGIVRGYTTVQYDEWGPDPIEGGIEPKLGTGSFSDWAYAYIAEVQNAALEPALGTSFLEKLRASDVSSYSRFQEGYRQSQNPALAGTPVGSDVSYRKVEVGDILFYDAATQTGQMVTGIEQTLYGDHYFTSAYTLQKVVFTNQGSNQDPEVTAAALGIEIGDHVRVSRGGVSVRTTIRDFAPSYTVESSIPGMVSAPYGISFTDSIEALRAESGPVSIDRIAEPDLTYICVHDNRLWGVHEGRIWCSKLGDPQNFDADTGTDADAWWAEVGSPGDWTGIVSYSGAVLAFKENLVHKVVGDLPSEFTVSTYNIAGIQPGSHQSAAIVNEVLYYKGTNGVYAYSGYTPSFISPNFGERKFAGAVGGTDGARYYLSMQDEAGAWQLYCYDTIRGVWLREDGLHAAAFSLYDGRLYCAAEEQGVILTFGEPVEPGVPWSAVSVPFYEGSFDRKQVTKLLIRAELPAGSTIRVAISYDGGAWQELYNTRAPRWRVAILPVRPKRCDSFRLRVEGEGDITLRGIAREVLTGSEV